MTNTNGNQGRTLKIIRASDAIPVDHPIVLIVGQPGICKSSLGFSAKDPLTLNFDGKNGLARAVNRRDAIDIATIDELRELRKDKESLSPYSTIVMDTVGRAVDLMALEVIDDIPKYGRSGSLTLQGFGELKTRFRLWVTELRTMGKDIVFIAHSKEDKDGEVVFNRPDIQGASMSEVVKIADFVGFIYMNGKHRVIDFNPSEKWFGKNPAGWPAKQVPAPEKAQDFLALLFDEGRSALGKASEASAAVANQVDDFRTVFSEYKTVQEFNVAIVAVIKTLPEGVKQQVGKVLLDVAEKRGLKFDRERKVFVQPEQEPVTLERLFQL